jgi:uncharacterized protein YegP (UPF0339 family)
MTYTFAIHRSDKTKYYFTFSRSDEIILISEGFNFRSSCESAINLTRASAQIASRYEKKGVRKGEYFFILHASNDMPLATSPKYSSVEERDNAIDLVRKNGSKAAVL